MNTLYEYRTTFALIPESFPQHEKLAEQLSKISPKPPKGEDWQLVSSSPVVTMEGTMLLYFWERPTLSREYMEPHPHPHSD